MELKNIIQIKTPCKEIYLNVVALFYEKPKPLTYFFSS